MKVLLYNDFIYKYGGAEKYVFGLARALRDQGVQVAIAGMVPNGRSREVQIPYLEGVDIFPISIPEHIQKLPLSKAFENALTSIIKKVAPDVIHLNNIYRLSHSLLRTLLQVDIPYIVTVHDYRPLCPTGWGVTKRGYRVCPYLRPGPWCILNGCTTWDIVPRTLRIFAVRQILAHASAILSPSRHLAAALTRRYPNIKERTIVLRNFLDLEQYPYYGYSMYRHGLFTFIGRIEEYKGVHQLIRAFLTAENNNAEFADKAKLYIVGRGTLLESLRRKYAGLQRVKILGYVSAERLRELYQLSHAVIVPSIYMENSPYVIYEAFAHGKFVLASNRGGCAELVTEAGAGMTVDVLNTDNFAKALVDTYNLTQDVLKTYGERGRQYAERFFSKEIHLRRLMTIYSNGEPN